MAATRGLLRGHGEREHAATSMTGSPVMAQLQRHAFFLTDAATMVAPEPVHAARGGLGPLWGGLGQSGGRLGVVLGRLGRVAQASWARLGPSWARLGAP